MSTISLEDGATAAPDAKPAMPCRGLSFLVVEDHEFQRRAMLQLLTRMGASSVQSAADGQEALKLIADCELPFDVVVCDVNMPGMDGMEFIRRWSERGDPTSLILMSAIEPDVLATVAHMALAYKARLLGVIAKPASIDRLTDLIDLHRSQAAGYREESGFSFQEITQAWAGDEFECWFEPQVHLATGAPRSLCAAPRWRHPTRGVLEPQDFMPAILARDLNDDLAWLLLQDAAARCVRWQREGNDLTVSVPLSFRTLSDARLAPRIQHILQREGLHPRSMILKISEAALGGNDLAGVLENLARLRLMGFGLAIDDFGSGCMEVDQLSLAAFTELRIGRSFVAGAARDETTRIVLAVALEAAHRLKVQSIATGIASKDEWSLLFGWGCVYGQGPFIGLPMAGEAVPRWLNRWRTRELVSA